MNTFNRYYINSYANEVKDSTPFNVCLARSMEVDRCFIPRYFGARTETITSLGPLGLESRGLFFQSGDLA